MRSPQILSLVLLLAALSTCKTPELTATATAPVDRGPAYLGVLYISGPYGRPGVRVVQVVPDSPADRAGLRLGDLIVAANGYTIMEGSNLKVRIGSMSPGQTLQLVVVREDGYRKTLHAELEALPERYTRPEAH